MGAKSLLRALTVVVLAVFIPAPGIAGGKAITAPYDSDLAEFGCSAMTLGTCDGSATADKATGALAFGLSITSSAGGAVPDDGSGNAYTLVSTSHLVRKAVDVAHLVVNVHVNDAQAGADGILFSNGFGGYGYSFVSAEVTMNTCNCGGGTGIGLVDAQYGPTSVSNTDIAIPVDVYNFDGGTVAGTLNIVVNLQGYVDLGDGSGPVGIPADTGRVFVSSDVVVNSIVVATR